MMAMSVTMHPIWQSGGVILAAVVAIALLLQLLVYRFLPAALRREHTVLGAGIFSVIGTTYAVLLLIVGLSSPFHGSVTIPPDAYAAILAEMRVAP